MFKLPGLNLGPRKIISLGEFQARSAERIRPLRRAHERAPSSAARSHTERSGQARGQRDSRPPASFMISLPTSATPLPTPIHRAHSTGEGGTPVREEEDGYNGKCLLTQTRIYLYL